MLPLLTKTRQPNKRVFYHLLHYFSNPPPGLYIFLKESWQPGTRRQGEKKLKRCRGKIKSVKQCDLQSGTNPALFNAMAAALMQAGTQHSDRSALLLLWLPSPLSAPLERPASLSGPDLYLPPDMCVSLSPLRLMPPPCPCVSHFYGRGCGGGWCWWWKWGVRLMVVCILFPYLKENFLFHCVLFQLRDTYVSPSAVCQCSIGCGVTMKPLVIVILCCHS